MKRKGARKLAVALPATLAAAACLARIAAEYQLGNNFQPTVSDRVLQNNQVLFPDDRDNTRTDENSSDDSDSAWEKDNSVEETRHSESGTNASYLFKYTDPLPDGSKDGILSNAPSAGEIVSGPSDRVYDIVDDPADADLVIRDDTVKTDPADPSQPGENGSSSGSGTGGGTGSDPTDPSPGSTPSGPSVGPSDDSGITPSYGSSSKDPDEGKSYPDMGDGVKNDSYDESVAPANPDGEGVNGSVVITRPFSWDNLLYKGQTIIDRTVYNALDTYVMGADGVRYLWGSEEYGKYICIDGVSFDGGATWVTDFPAMIPADMDSNELQIRSHYRFSTKGEWTERIISYYLEDSRVMILGERLKEANTTITPSLLLNDGGINQYFGEGDQVNLLYYFFAYFEQRGECGRLSALLPGWEENGKQVPWFYTVNAGRHVIEPMTTVPLSDNYVVELELQWMSEDLEVGFQHSHLSYLQTLVDYEGGELIEGRATRYVEQLSVPKYIQAIALHSDARLLIGYLVIPDTVLYIDDLGEGLTVYEGYEVSSDNPFYASDEGVLLNKDRTKILGIPTRFTWLTVPETVTEIDFPSKNALETLRLEATTMETMPEVSFGKLNSGCKIIVNDDLLSDFLMENRGVIEKNQLRVASVADPELSYTIRGGLLIDSKGALCSVISASGTVNLSGIISSIGANAFADAPGVRELVLSKDGSIVELEPDSLAGSGIETIYCYTQEQYDAVMRGLSGANAPQDVSVLLLLTSREGFVYGNGILVSAPADLKEFYGTVTAEDGTPVTINAIGDGAFSGCEQLIWAVLPESVSTIGAAAFEGCTSLEGVLIDAKDCISIGNEAFEGCSALRFVASNAQYGILEDGYDFSIPDTYWENNVYLFAPTGCVGYTGNWTCFVAESGVYSYTLEDIGDGGKMLYGTDAEGTPWLGIRSGSEVADEVKLPTSTTELFLFSMAQTSSPSGGFTVNWDELPEGLCLGGGCLRDSQISGDLVLGQNYRIGNSAFTGCTGLTSVAIPGDQVALEEMVFSSCSSLKTACIGKLWNGGVIYSGIFSDCNALTTVTLDSDTVPPGVLGSLAPFRFNLSWTQQEEQEKLQLIVPEEIREDYVKEWRYLAVGQFDALGQTAYWRLRNDLRDEYFMNTWTFPEDDVVDTMIEERLFAADNYLRGILGLEPVEEVTDLYHYDVFNEIVTVRATVPSLTDAKLTKEELGLANTEWSIGYLASGTFSRSTQLQSVWLPDTLLGIESGILTGVESDCVTLTFTGETPPELTGYSPERPFTFGIGDSRVRLVFEEGADPAEYIRSWLFAMAGYDNMSQMRRLISAELQGDSETAPTEEEVTKAIEERLIQAENRLREMIGMDPVDRVEDMIGLQKADPDQKTEVKEDAEEPKTTEDGEELLQ